MFSAIRSLGAFTLALGLAGSLNAAPPALRICADPNNLPYSNRQQQGFENRLAKVLADDLHMPVTYVWFSQRRKFFDRTLRADVCDAVMSVPAGLKSITATAPYYRSSYVFVTRHTQKLHISSFDDPRLRNLRIGVQILGDDSENVPPVLALNSRGIIRNVTGYSVFGERLDARDPQEQLIKAVADNSVDVAVAWGPTAGYYARKSAIPLDLTAVSLDSIHPDLPLSFAIAIGVRKGNLTLKRQLDAALRRQRKVVTQLLRAYEFPDTRVSANSSAQEVN